MDNLSDYIGDRTVSAQTGFYIFLAGAILVALLALFVRLWFDIAQVRAVVQDEHKMWPNLWKALGISWRNVSTLFRVYLCISGVAWVTLAVGLFIWAKLPPTATPVTLLLLEFIILMQLLTRLWQRASTVTWYQRHAAMVPADAVDYTTPAPVELVELPSTFPDRPVPESEATRIQRLRKAPAATMSANYQLFMKNGARDAPHSYFSLHTGLAPLRSAFNPLTQMISGLLVLLAVPPSLCPEPLPGPIPPRQDWPKS